MSGPRLWNRLKGLDHSAVSTYHHPCMYRQGHGWQTWRGGYPITGFFAGEEEAMEAGIKILEESTTQSSKEN